MPRLLRNIRHWFPLSRPSRLTCKKQVWYFETTFIFSFYLAAADDSLTFCNNRWRWNEFQLRKLIQCCGSAESHKFWIFFQLAWSYSAKWKVSFIECFLFHYLKWDSEVIQTKKYSIIINFFFFCCGENEEFLPVQVYIEITINKTRASHLRNSGAYARCWTEQGKVFRYQSVQRIAHTFSHTIMFDKFYIDLTRYISF